MREPLVSILLPAFNAAATLDACLRSIQRQTERRWECVIVDDGSTDGTLACARRVAECDPRIVVVPTAHRGLVAALNAGLERCRGRFVARMDADDLMHRERLAAQVAALAAQPRLAAVGCHVRLFPRRGLRDGLRAYERWLNGIDSAARVRAEAFVECPVAHPTLMIRRDVLVPLGYRDCGWAEDYDLVLRLLLRGGEIGVVPWRLVSWRDAPGRLWRRGDSYGQERFTACKAAFLAADFLAAADAYVLCGYGGTGRALQRALQRPASACPTSSTCIPAGWETPSTARRSFRRTSCRACRAGRSWSRWPATARAGRSVLPWRRWDFARCAISFARRDKGRPNRAPASRPGLHPCFTLGC